MVELNHVPSCTPISNITWRQPLWVSLWVFKKILVKKIKKKIIFRVSGLWIVSHHWRPLGCYPNWITHQLAPRRKTKHKAETLLFHCACELGDKTQVCDVSMGKGENDMFRVCELLFHHWRPLGCYPNWITHQLASRRKTKHKAETLLLHCACMNYETKHKFAT